MIWWTCFAIFLTLILFRVYSKKFLTLMQQFFFLQDVNVMNNINCFVKLKGDLSVEKTNEIFSQLKTFEEFRNTVEIYSIFDIPRFKKVKNFDPKDHIYHYDFSDEKYLSKKALQAEMVKFCRKPLDIKKPLWELHSFHNLKTETGSSYTLHLFRVHHVLCDGNSAMRLMLSLVDVEKPKIKKITKRHREKVGIIKMAMYNIIEIIKAFGLSPDSNNIFATPKISGEFKMDWKDNCLSVEEIKKIAKSSKIPGASINDVLLSSMSKSLNDYNQKHFKNHQVGKKVELKTVLWVDKGKVNWVNSKPPNIKKLKLDVASLVIDISLENNPKKRLEETVETTKNLLISAMPFATNFIFKLLGFLPKMILLPINDSLIGKASISMSNVPGPQYKMIMKTVLVDSIFFVTVPSVSIRCYLCILSYDGKISLSTMVDSKCVEYPEEILNGIVKQVNLLKDL